MTIIYSRLAHNYACQGYYPTDDDTVAAICNVLQPCSERKIRIMDVCAGQGDALLACQQHLGVDNTDVLAVELNSERADTARQQLGHCLCCDFMECNIEPQSTGLLFLNPPYGDITTYEREDIKLHGGRQRLEKWFFQKAYPLLQIGGILVFIFPDYVMDDTLSQWLTRHFTEVSLFAACTSRFKQCIMIGKRQKASLDDSAVRRLAKQLREQCDSQTLPTISEVGILYNVPAITKENVNCRAIRLDEAQLETVVTNEQGLWSRFDALFQGHLDANLPPLMDVCDWHLALTLAAGCVSGIVTDDKTGYRYLIKGDTHKAKIENIDMSSREDGSTVEKRILLDHFVPVIRAIDVTQQSPNFGRVYTLQ